jgi:hypothetical protein
MLLLSIYLQLRCSASHLCLPSLSLNSFLQSLLHLYFVKMQNRKRSATIMDASTETAPTSDGGDEPSRGALQPRPNPPAKRPRMLPSGQSDKDEPAGEPCQAQKAVKVKPKPSASRRAAAAPTLPPELWRLIGQNVSTSSLCSPSLRQRTDRCCIIATPSSNLEVARQSLSDLPRYIYPYTLRLSHHQPRLISAAIV